MLRVLVLYGTGASYALEAKYLSDWRDSLQLRATIKYRYPQYRWILCMYVCENMCHLLYSKYPHGISGVLLKVYCCGLVVMQGLLTMLACYSPVHVLSELWLKIQ